MLILISKNPFFNLLKFIIVGGNSSYLLPGKLKKIPPPFSYYTLFASYDIIYVAYTAVATAQSFTNELIKIFKPMVTKFLKRYYNRNKLFPRLGRLLA